MAKKMELQSVELYSLFTDFDIDLFKSGKHFKLYEKFGSHTLEYKGVTGTYFSVWAPSAREVSVMGNFNGWNKFSHSLNVRWDSSGIWEGFIPNIGRGELYKYCIHTQEGSVLEKADPFALFFETPPKTSSIVWDNWHEWKDAEWMEKRIHKQALNQPISVYEMHLGSWRKNPEKPHEHLSYRELAPLLIKHIKELGFTHVEFLPVMEHPFEPSWGYQITGYFAANSRMGTPQDFMYLVEELHNNDIGVFLDWVPSHFPGDSFALYQFDGTHLYEHPDHRRGYHPDWKSYIFNYGRNEVRSFLISNALYWLERYHVDGLRVDAVASMLYLDYSRSEGEWEANIFGGNQNLEAISFLRELNETIYHCFPDVHSIAEESTAFSGVSKPVWMGGLGFGMKWMMGWMNDSLKYFSREAIYRKWHQNELTFSSVYGFSENFMLPISHDEVSHGKGSLLAKMPGDEWQQKANLRLFFTFMMTHFGTKLLFMGSEFGQWNEWDSASSLDWHLLENEPHKGIQRCLSTLLHLYKSEPALYEKQFSQEGFEWIDISDTENSVVVFMRKSNHPKDSLVIVLNLTPITHHQYRIGLPSEGQWKEIFNSDDKKFGGSGCCTNKTLKSEKVFFQHKENSIELKLPPLAGIILKIK